MNDSVKVILSGPEFRDRIKAGFDYPVITEYLGIDTVEAAWQKYRIYRLRITEAVPDRDFHRCVEVSLDLDMVRAFRGNLFDFLFSEVEPHIYALKDVVKDG